MGGWRRVVVMAREVWGGGGSTPLAGVSVVKCKCENVSREII